MFTIAVNGTYPRFPDPPRPALLRRAIDNFAAGKIEEKELERAKERASVEVVAEIIAAGVEIPGGGQIHWGNPESFICGRMSGFEIDEEPTTVDSHHSPRVVDKVRWIRPILLDEFKFLSERTPVEVRPVITGPFSLSFACDFRDYRGGDSAFQDDLAAALNRELLGLEAAGAKYILVEEPMLANRKQFIDDFLRMSEILLEGVETSVMLGTSRGDLTQIIDRLNGTDFGGFGLDMIEGSGNEELLEAKAFPEETIIQLGVVHSRHPRLEEPDEIRDMLLKWADFHDPDLLWAAPSGGLGILPRDLAFEKLVSLYKGVISARKQLAGEEQPGGMLPDDNSDPD